jgi:hypothetical protein
VQTVTDTLGFVIAQTADWTQQPILYGSSTGGYVCGNNAYLDKQKVQVFRPGQPCTVEGAIYWFGGKTVGANANVNMRVYHLDGTGQNSTGTGIQSPNTTYVSDPVALANVDTSLSLLSAYVHTFSTPQFCAGDFGVGFDVSGLGAGDTIGCVSSTDPNAILEDAWEQWSDNSWNTFAVPNPNGWGLNLALAIFPLVDMNVGINETPFISGVKMGFAGPNPTADNTVLTYGLQNNAKNVTITIVDQQGRIVATQSFDNQVAGNYTYNVNSSAFAAGTYFVQLQADNSRLAVKMVKQ